MDITDRIEQIIAPALHEEGFAVVRVQLSGAQRQTLQIMIEQTDGTTVTIAQCAKSSRMISAILDVEDVIKDAYMLEVSSPGIDRPLVKAADYERFMGQEVTLEAKMAIEGLRRFHGCIEKFADHVITLKLIVPHNDKTHYNIPLNLVQRCKLVPQISFKRKEEEGQS